MKNIETVKAVIKKTGKDSFLLLKIKNRKIWQFVTGKIEGNESEVEAVRREIYEETGLSKDSIKDIKKMEFKDNFSQNNHRIKSTIFLVKVRENVKIDISSNPDGIEHEDFKWVPKNEVFERLKFENQREFFRKIIQYLK